MKKVPFNIRIDERLKRVLDEYCKRSEGYKYKGRKCSKTRMIEGMLYKYLHIWGVWDELLSRKEERELRELHGKNYFFY